MEHIDIPMHYPRDQDNTRDTRRNDGFNMMPPRDSRYNRDNRDSHDSGYQQRDNGFHRMPPRDNRDSRDTRDSVGFQQMDGGFNRMPLRDSRYEQRDAGYHRMPPRDMRDTRDSQDPTGFQQRDGGFNRMPPRDSSIRVTMDGGVGSRFQQRSPRLPPPYESNSQGNPGFQPRNGDYKMPIPEAAKRASSQGSLDPRAVKPNKKNKDKYNKNKDREKEKGRGKDCKDTPRVRNTESFEPMTKPVDMRIVIDLGKDKTTLADEQVLLRDVIIAPNVFIDFATGEVYSKLVSEIEACGDELQKLWHGDTHIIADDHMDWKSKSPTFQLVLDRLGKFFDMDIQATRLNWYKDTSHWKPFHHDAAALKEDKALLQNFTVAVSFGATRDAAFENAKTRTVVSMPQPDGSIYAFAKDTNVLWRHGILKEDVTREEGRISIIAWGQKKSKDTGTTTS